MKNLQQVLPNILHFLAISAHPYQHHQHLHQQAIQIAAQKKFRSNPIDDEYASAINHLAESMSQPITINSTDIIRNTPTPSSDSIDTFVVFIGSLLRTIKNEGIKLEAMNSITQTAFDAKSKDITNDV